MRLTTSFPTISAADLQFRLEGDERTHKDLVRLQDHLIPDAMRDALRYAVKGLQVDISKTVRQYYTLPANTIKGDVGRPHMRTDSRMYVNLNYRPRTARQFRGRQVGTPRHRRGLGRGRGWQALRPSTRHGYSWQVFKAGPRYIERRGFEAKGLPWRRLQRANYPIEVIHGPSLGGVFSPRARYGPRIRREVGDLLNERLYAGLVRGMRRYARQL